MGTTGPSSARSAELACVPAEYGTAMIENSLSLLATATTADDLLAAWQVP